MRQSQRWCLTCKRYTLHGKQTLSCAVGCVLVMLVSILVVCCTGLLGSILLPIMLPVLVISWLLIAVLHSLVTPWRCQHCGTTGNPSFMPRPRPRPAFPSVGLPSIDWTLPSIDWDLVLSRLRRLPYVVNNGIFASWSQVETAYAHLPDWAQPIVWALGLSTPVVIVAVGIWTAIHL